MTAEIVILNRSGVALAADSAVTIGQERVWKSTNKLFHLSSDSDVGVMFYGGGDYCGFPWEVIIKEFRKSLGSRTFPKLTDYADKFTEFLSDFELQDGDLARTAIRLIFLSALEECTSRVSGKSAVERRDSFVRCAAEMEQEVEVLDTLFEDVEYKDFEKLYGEDVHDLLADTLTNIEKDRRFGLTGKTKAAARQLCYASVIRRYPSEIYTGVVFAGFGEREILPVLASMVIDGSLFGYPRVWGGNYRNMNDDSNLPSAVFSFAQSDMVNAFIEGANHDVVDWVESAIQTVLSEKSKSLVEAYVPMAEQIVEKKLQEDANSDLVSGMMKAFDEMRHEQYVRRMLRVVSSLPKDEMAAMAEALVEITSLRRKMDSSLESVGGPVDVAVISKADGYVWIKRKHYFDLNLNKDFIYRRARRFSGSGGGNEGQET